MKESMQFLGQFPLEFSTSCNQSAVSSMDLPISETHMLQYLFARQDMHIDAIIAWQLWG